MGDSQSSRTMVLRGGGCAEAMEEAQKFTQNIMQQAEALSGGAGPDGFSNDQMAEALKQALEEGVRFACEKASQAGGFNNNPSIHIPFPEEAQEVIDKLRQLGMGDICDKLVDRMNEAAEKAAALAVDICVNAVMSMSVDDAKNIITGADNACTEYLRRTTKSSLHRAMRPIVHEAMEAVHLQDIWDAVREAWDKVPSIPFVWEKPDFPDMSIDDYVLQKGCDGIFYLTAEKEKDIRDDVMQATSELVQQVFGALLKR